MAHPLGVAHNYHHRFVLVLPIGTPGYVHVDGVSYFLKPGLAYLIFPHQFHHFLNTPRNEMAWLFMTFECEARGSIAPLKNSPRILSQQAVSLVDEILGEYVDTKHSDNRDLELVYKSSLLIRELLNGCKVAPRMEDPSREEDGRGKILQQINRYVRENLDKSLTIADIARHTGYSVSYLRAIFREMLGVSLGAYMRDSRLSMAAAMLSQPNRPKVEEIATACGFASIFAFSHAFRKAMGVPPSAYGRRE